jgi:hypothetical protein
VRVACVPPAPLPPFSGGLTGWRSRGRGGRTFVDTSLSSSRGRLARIWRYAEIFAVDLAGQICHRRLVLLLAVVLLWKELVASLKSSDVSPLNKAWGLGVLPLLDLHPPSSPTGRGGEGRRGAGGDLGCGALQRRGVSNAATSTTTVVLGRPPIYAVHRLRRGVHQQGTQDDDHRPAPASTGQ